MIFLQLLQILCQLVPGPGGAGSDITIPQPKGGQYIVSVDLYLIIFSHCFTSLVLLLLCSLLALHYPQG